MDVLSDVLRVVRLTSAVFFTVKFSDPWSIESPPPDQLGRSLGLNTESIALFHVLVEGRCWVAIDGYAPLLIEAPEVIIFPHGNSHTISSRVGARPQAISTILPVKRSEEIPRLDYGGGGEAARFVCGILHCDQRFNPLIGALPTMISVSVRDTPRSQPVDNKQSLTRAGMVQVEADGWLGSTLTHTIDEANAMQPGSSAMLARLTELLYVEVLRRYMEQLPFGQTTWLAGVQDPEVG